MNKQQLKQLKMSIELSSEDAAMLEFATTKMLDSNQGSDQGLTSLDSLLAAAAATPRMEVQNPFNDDQINSSSTAEKQPEITSSDGLASNTSDSNSSAPINNENVLSSSDAMAIHAKNGK